MHLLWVLGLTFNSATGYLRAEEARLSPLPDVPDIAAVPVAPAEAIPLSELQSSAGTSSPRTLVAETVSQRAADTWAIAPQSPESPENRSASTDASPPVFRALPVSSSTLTVDRDNPGHLRWMRYLQERIRRNPDAVAAIVTEEVTAQPKETCSIVKVAIEASGADIPRTAKIVEAAAMANPESMRLAAQCAIAVMPDALGAVQEVLAKLDPAGRIDMEGDAKDAKDAKGEVASAISPPNPLNAPPGPPPGIPYVIPPEEASPTSFTVPQ